MCCLFGMIDVNNNFTGREKSNMLSILAVTSEERGTDATGIAYNINGKLHIYKRPCPAHKMKMSVPNSANVIMGHTRMTTQGSEKKNFNNHPFLGNVNNESFAFAHNGILYNDKILRKNLKLPYSKIETDSYVAVQIIEKKKALNFESLKYMAEQVAGSFVFTALNHKNDLYIVRGDNPFCLCYFPETKLYLYASTENILVDAIKKMKLKLEKPERIDIQCGDILCICANGELMWNKFDASSLMEDWQFPLYSSLTRRYYSPYHDTFEEAEAEYLEDLKSIAAYLGYDSETVDYALQVGFTADEIEELLYEGRF